jgi:hypothetical protein
MSRKFSLICSWSWDHVDKISAYDPKRKRGRVYTGFSQHSLKRVQRAIATARPKKKKGRKHVQP